MTLYALPKLGRSGLGNMLFPWARAEIFARRHQARILAPLWTPFRIGPYLRREPDKRTYLSFFDAQHHVRGLEKWAICAAVPRVAESDFDEADAANQKGTRLVEFHGLGAYFASLLHEYEFVRKALWDMTTPRFRDGGPQYGGRYIAMHIRRGDLTRQRLSGEQLMRVGQFTPLEWFIAIAHSLRRQIPGGSVPIVVFTDGSDDEVFRLLKIDNVHLHQRKAAIADLWSLSQARLLIASGFSTFSMWASYLGGMPTVYAPGKIQEYVQIGRPAGVEITLDVNDDVPAAALRGLM